MQEGAFTVSAFLNALKGILSFLVANAFPIVLGAIVTLVLREYIAWKVNLRNERIYKYEKLIENIYGPLKSIINGFVKDENESRKIEKIGIWDFDMKKNRR